MSSRRYVIEMSCGQPFIRDGIEFVVVTVRGQSFMLHQIRKMIGMAIAIVRGFATIDSLKKCFDCKRIDIPRAPGLGLMLEEVHYNNYNKRFGGDGQHEPLTWTEYNDQIVKFRDDYIYPIVVNGEKNGRSMMAWLETLPYHTYDERESGPPNNLKNTVESANSSDQSDTSKQATDLKRAAFMAGKIKPRTPVEDAPGPEEEEEEEAKDGEQDEPNESALSNETKTEAVV